MTDGPDGSYVSDGKTIWFLPIFDGPVIERTGAGDSYGSGFLAAILSGKPVNEAMLWGNANSTSVVEKIGAREGLLNQDGIAEGIAKNTQYVPEEFAKF
jgi:sugar/nucleoside kinase (ribokinase family)